MAKLYKISVYDMESDRYLVKRCSMKKSEAVQMERELTEQGILCRVSENVRDSGGKAPFYCADFISKR